MLWAFGFGDRHRDLRLDRLCGWQNDCIMYVAKLLGGERRAIFILLAVG
jgi:hypothetical protein